MIDEIGEQVRRIDRCGGVDFKPGKTAAAIVETEADNDKVGAVAQYIARKTRRPLRCIAAAEPCVTLSPRQAIVTPSLL